MNPSGLVASIFFGRSSLIWLRSKIDLLRNGTVNTGLVCRWLERREPGDDRRLELSELHRLGARQGKLSESGLERLVDGGFREHLEQGVEILLGDVIESRYVETMDGGAC